MRGVEGTANTGEATELWIAMIARLRADDPDAAAIPQGPMTAPERVWSSLIVSRLPRWQSEIPALASTFTPAEPPPLVQLVIGRGGGEDAFTHDATTIGFDVARLFSVYGDATLPANAERIDRFFRHEYTHILQKAWLASHPYPANTPLRAALLGIWTEGLGNYHSLSDRWRNPDTARAKLDELTPRLLARLAALACASPEHTQALSAQLSTGPFDRKWGALPIALWLAEDQRRSPSASRDFVTAGPDAVWMLLDRHLLPESRAVAREIRATAHLCGAP